MATSILTPAAPAQQYNSAQLLTALQTIAARSATLNRLLIRIQNGQLEHAERTALVDASQLIAEALGAMADRASGSLIVGDADRWNYGPVFKNLETADRPC